MPQRRNALQELIAEHCRDTGDTLAGIAARGGLSRQTVSAIAHRDHPGAIPRRDTLRKLANGLGLSLELVERAAATAASSTTIEQPTNLRLSVLLDRASKLDERDLETLVGLARLLESDTTRR